MTKLYEVTYCYKDYWRGAVEADSNEEAIKKAQNGSFFIEPENIENQDQVAEEYKATDLTE